MGPPARQARLAAILVHGRGASAEDILELAREFAPDDVAYFAPQASGSTWYPYSFLAPIAQNEPGITSGLNKIRSLVEMLQREAVAQSRMVLLGFSQGACLSLEFAARHAGRYKAVIGLSGGLIGPPGTLRTYTESMQGTPVFLGCSDIDPHIPLVRVQ
jgi:predicted esterase